ncbi:hypothetical protein [Paratractidigestivibacter sp.]|uniref:hypothetical protein n=1 Tax=Paratractidigestivibacter sp. TaxID=2847316 RepID=UPI002ABD1DF8|nr:hypothetical protein [Paratractidigestivibacter sp.]
MDYSNDYQAQNTGYVQQPVASPPQYAEAGQVAGARTAAYEATLDRGSRIGFKVAGVLLALLVVLFVASFVYTEARNAAQKAAQAQGTTAATQTTTTTTTNSGRSNGTSGTTTEGESSSSSPVSDAVGVAQTIQDVAYGVGDAAGSFVDTVQGIGGTAKNIVLRVEEAIEAITQ